jgi:hypothetical protein
MEKIKIPRHPVFRDFALVQTISGLYVCPNWIPVPDGTTREDIEFADDMIIDQVKASSEVTKESQQGIEFNVPSSNGKSTYIVKFQRGVWSCTCPAASFRRGNCKHVKEKMESVVKLNESL